MRLARRLPLLAIGAAVAVLPGTAAAAPADASGTAATAGVPGGAPPLISLTAGLSINLLGINLTLGSPPPAQPVVPGGDSTLLGLSLGTQVGVNAGPVSAQVDANVGATVTNNGGAAVAVETNVNVPGLVDTGVALDATLPPAGSGQAASGSLHVKGLDQAVSAPASGSTGATPPPQRPSAVVSGTQTPAGAGGTTAPSGNGTGTGTNGSGPKVVTGPPTTNPPVTNRPPRGRTPAVDVGSPQVAPALSQAPVAVPLEVTDLPVSREVLDAAVATGRTLALPLALLAALLAYLGLQRLLDRGPKLAWADGRTPPDDELLEI
jgi:hypothetical protein